jgi:hypothetical protein
MDKDGSSDNALSDNDVNSSNTETVAESNDKTGEELKTLKIQYENGEISVEEFNLAVNKLLDNL